MPDCRATAWWIAAVMLVVPSGGHAQWWLDLGMGRSSYDVVAPQLDTDNASIAFRYSGINWIELAAGVPLSSTGNDWGSVSAGGRWTGAGRTTFGLAANGQLFAQRDRAGNGLSSVRGATIEATPLLRVGAASANLEFRAGAIAHWSHYDGQTEARFIPSGWVLLERPLSEVANLVATARLVRVEGRVSSFLGLGSTYDTQRWGAWGRVGRWLTDLEHRSEWSAGAYLNARDRLQFYGSLHRDADDPIHETTARLTWALGVSYALRDGPTAVPEPVPLEVSRGRVVLRIRRSEAETTPSVAGDFTGWSPQPMQAEEDYWSAHFELTPGLYRFAFIDGSGAWFLPESVVHRVTDSYGGENGVIVVR